MANGYYTQEEVLNLLGKDEDEIRDLVVDGKLREFRDAGKLLYKREDVDALAGELGVGASAVPPAEAGADDHPDDLVLEPAEDSRAGEGIGSGEGSGTEEVLLHGSSALGSEPDSGAGDISFSLEDSSTDAGGGSGSDMMSDASAAALEMLAGGTEAGGPEGSGLADSGIEAASGSGTEIPLELSEGGSVSFAAESGTEIPIDLSDDSLGELSAEVSGGSAPAVVPAGEGEAAGESGPVGGSGGPGLSPLGESGTAIPLDLSGDTGEGTGGGEGDGGGAGTSVFTLEDADADVGDGQEGAKKDDTVITSVGISVFDDEDLEIDADPQAKTVMSEAGEVLGDAMGSGSGLLDLTRESDDTSLGAELLEEIYPGGKGEPSGGDVEMGDDTKAGLGHGTGIAPAAEEAESFAPMRAVAPAAPVVQVAAGAEDPLTGMMTGLLTVGLLVMLIGGLVSVANIRDVWPAPLEMLHQKFWIFVGVSAGLTAIVALVGFLLSRPRAPKPQG